MRNRSDSFFVFLKNSSLGFSAASLLTLLLGLFLLVAPGASTRLLVTLIGLFVTAYGLLNISSYLFGRRSGMYTFELLLGIVAAAFGLFSLFDPDFLVDFLFTVLGLLILVFSIGGIKRALNLKAFGFPHWVPVMAHSCIILLLSASILLFPGFYGSMLMRIIGLLLTVQSVGDLFALNRLGRYR